MLFPTTAGAAVVAVEFMPAMVSSDGSRRWLGGGGGVSVDPEDEAAAAAASPFLVVAASEPFLNLNDEASLK